MNLFHLVNRGVEKRIIALDDRDRIRFVHDLYEMNDTKSASEFSRRPMWDLRNPTSIIKDWENNHQKREQLIDIHSWCLMKNHYHILVSERIDGGITKFLRKFNVGYANAFNARYDRSGALYQGRTKKILVESYAHFLYILYYIHANPLDYLDGAQEWRNGNIKSSQKALKYLNEYKWSSYNDYCGKKNFPSLITTSFFSDAPGDHKQKMADFIKDREKTSF